ncbi:MAG: outer membrane beta-barrel protein [Bacteroidales bacterium]
MNRAMTKILTHTCIIFLLSASLSAQTFSDGKSSYFRNNPITKHPGIGLTGAGTMFMGDISEAEEGVIMPAVGIKADYRLTHTFAVEVNLMAGYLAQSYSEPALKLNDFESTFGQGHLSLRIHLDRLFQMKPHALVSPYLTAGVGYMIYESYVNIYDKDGDPYVILADGTIADVDRNPVTRDDEYETPIDEDGDYGHNAMIYPIGAGVKFNFSEHFEMALEGLYFLTDHDYFEGYLAYKNTSEGWKRMDENDGNDAYLTAGLTFTYNFGFNTKRRARRPVDPYEPHFKH